MQIYTFYIDINFADPNTYPNDKLKDSGRDKPEEKTKYRRKRDVTQYEVELFIVVDYSVYEL